MADKYNPWTVVNLVFKHLADEGMEPILGASGDPGDAASQLLTSLGIEPAVDGGGKADEHIQQELADLRAVFDDIRTD